MSRLIFDIEADGLLDTVSQCWCIVTLDIDTKEMKEYYSDGTGYTNHPLGGLDALLQADLLIGHNIVGYDIPALTKLYSPSEPWPKVLDTLITSRFLWPERPWGHSLEAWGEHLGNKKGDFHDWSKFSTEMLEYCKQDVWVNYEIYKQLEKDNEQEFEGFRIYT